MRQLVAVEFVTLDGVIEGPGFDEHRDGRNAWALRLQSPETQQYIADQYRSSDIILLGRTTYEIWAAFWPTMPPDDVFAKLINETPKYVVSGTLKIADWQNTTILGADWPERVAELKSQDGKGILVTGSADLVGGLLERGLIDELQLLVFPVVLGSGKHLFRDGIDTTYWRLAASRVFDSGTVALTYRPESEMPTSEYIDSYAWTGVQTRSLHAAQDVNRVLATVLSRTSSTLRRKRLRWATSAGARCSTSTTSWPRPRSTDGTADS